jgi:hypothetical protein
METAVEAQTKPVLPQAPLADIPLRVSYHAGTILRQSNGAKSDLARSAALSVENLTKTNAMMYLVLCLVDSEVEAAGAPSASTKDQVRRVIDIVAAGAGDLSRSDA